MRLKVCQLNCENLFLLSHESLHENKSIEKCELLASCLLEIDPDVLLMSEVGGLESLNTFNDRYLNQGFLPHLIEGNSERGIDVAALTKKSSGLGFEYFSNRDLNLDFIYPHEEYKKLQGKPLTPHKLSRDVAELWVYHRGDPLCIMLNCHLKSKRDSQQVDPSGKLRRSAELKLLLKLYQSLASRQSLPIFVAGDFNGNASRYNTDAEFLPIYQETDLEDALELVGADSRSTYFSIQRSYQSPGMQLDYFFAPKTHQNLVRHAQVHRYKDVYGMPLKHPPGFSERPSMPSDHFPLVIELEFENLTVEN